MIKGEVALKSLFATTIQVSENSFGIGRVYHFFSFLNTPSSFLQTF